MSTKLICVPVAEVDVIYPVVEPMLKAAYEKFDQAFPDVVGWLKRLEGSLWIVVEENSRVIAALTASIEKRPSGLVLRLVANGGTHVALWKHHIADIEDWYRGQGVKKVIFEGRPGWARVIPGYRLESVTLEKVL